MNANDRRGLTPRVLALVVSATAVLLFTSFLSVPVIRSGPMPDELAEEVARGAATASPMDAAGAAEREPEGAGEPGTERALAPAREAPRALGTAEALLRSSYGETEPSSGIAGGTLGRGASRPILRADMGDATTAVAGRVSAEVDRVLAAAGSRAVRVGGTRATAASRSAAAEPTGATGTRALTFREEQLAFPRVASAFGSKARRVASLFRAKGVKRPASLYLRVFKREQELEVWARPLGATRFVLLTTYPVCKISGRLGPKRRAGDGQIPEGFYSIDLFNPWSNYHLSLRVNYPNAADAARGRGRRLGGDIFIHGGCATIGCIPITDNFIEELYVMAVEARSAGQRRIPVHIFPTRLDDDGMDYLRMSYGGDFIDYPFWRNLQQGYEAFEETRMLPRIWTRGDHYTITPARGTPVAGGP